MSVIALLVSFAVLTSRVGHSVPDPLYAGRHASQWLREMASTDSSRRQAATNAFRALGTNALPILKQALHARDSYLRRHLIEWQWQFPSLRLDFYSNSAEPRWNEALDAATVLGTNAAPLLPELADAAGACGGFAYEEFLAAFGAPAVRPIASALNDCGNDSGMRGLLEALQLILASNAVSGVDEDLVIAACTSTLESKFSDFVDREAAYTLGRFGARSSKAIPALLDCLTNREGAKSSYPAAWALGQIRLQPQIVLPALVRATDKRRFYTVRAEAARAIGEFGSNATPLVPFLVRRSVDPEAEVRHAVMDALLKMDPNGRTTVSVLRRRLRDSHAYVRREAALLAGAVTTRPNPLQPRLKRLLTDPDAEVRKAAAATLAKYCASRADP